MALFNRTAREVPETRARNSQRADDALAAVRRRARQRFVGALVLVVGAVIVIPMLLDSDPRPLDRDIDISIPSRQTPFEPNLPSSSGQAPAGGPTASTPSAAEPDRTVAPVVAGSTSPVAEKKSEPATEKRADVKPADGKAADARPTESKQTESKQTEPKPVEPKQDPAPSVAMPAPSKSAEPAARPDPPAVSGDDARKAQALLEGKSPAAVAAGRYYVQIGAFANVDGVHDLQGRLRKAGVETYTEKLKTAKGDRLRVRAGPFDSRADADRTLAKVHEVGVDGAAVVQ